ncbi:hypothetical protein Back11_33540 [Paenibacillus baekrokdamisoli]|uniref:Uncharacterized protein n=1 Tax=Paenibacillus baekrokdamisoli TaxID=1712516 RepID=A0A3G9JGB0_9BACL|nr:hypothetical protein [Paenibacillus baekrokdamisoli]MBB3072933.1 hypothetical protein [Paenibacillus baekrokdamisoli]BBH22009.1 hypothetical protein Back11_33540 [Paenibacillus baekrokdamisoli]
MTEHQSNVTSLTALRTWKAIPQSLRDKLVRNVFCGKCKGAVEIVDFNIQQDKNSLILRGKCRICSGPVARVVENE